MPAAQRVRPHAQQLRLVALPPRQEGGLTLHRVTPRVAWGWVRERGEPEKGVIPERDGAVEEEEADGVDQADDVPAGLVPRNGEGPALEPRGRGRRDGDSAEARIPRDDLAKRGEAKEGSSRRRVDR